MPSANNRVAAGVDLGGTKIQTVVLRDGEVAGGSRMRTLRTGSPRDVIEAIVGTNPHITRAGLGRRIRSGGRRCRQPGRDRPSRRRRAAGGERPRVQRAVDLGPLISEELGGVDVTIDNDVRGGVLGEYRRGTGRPYKDVLGVWVGTGVGGSLILDGELQGD